MKKALLLLSFLSVVSFAGLEDMKFDIKTGISGRHLYVEDGVTKKDGSNEARVDYATLNFAVPSSKFKLKMEAYSKEAKFTDFTLDNLNASITLDYETPELAKDYTMFLHSKFTLAPHKSQGNFNIELGNNHYLNNGWKLYYSFEYLSHMIYKPQEVALKWGFDYNGSKYTNSSTLRARYSINNKPTVVITKTDDNSKTEVTYDYNYDVKGINSGKYVLNNYTFKHKEELLVSKQGINNAHKLTPGGSIATKAKKYINYGVELKGEFNADLNNLYKDLFLNLTAKGKFGIHVNNLKESHFNRMAGYTYEIDGKAVDYSKNPMTYEALFSAKLGYKVQAGEKVTITPSLLTEYKFTNSVNQLKFDAEAVLVANPIDHLTLELKANVPVAFTFADDTKPARYAYTGFGAGASVKYTW